MTYTYNDLYGADISTIMKFCGKGLINPNFATTKSISLIHTTELERTIQLLRYVHRRLQKYIFEEYETYEPIDRPFTLSSVNHYFEYIIKILPRLEAESRRRSYVVTCKEIKGQVQTIALHEQFSKPHRNSMGLHLHGVVVC